MKKFLILSTIAAGSVIFTAGCSVSQPTTAEICADDPERCAEIDRAVAAASARTVTYKVEGTTKMASITYQNAGGDTSQQSDIDVPIRRKDTSTWSQPDGGYGIRLDGMQPGDFLYISAQNSKDSGSITCKIEVDGIVVKTNTSRGGYTIATCSGRL